MYLQLASVSTLDLGVPAGELQLAANSGLPPYCSRAVVRNALTQYERLGIVHCIRSSESSSNAASCSLSVNLTAAYMARESGKLVGFVESLGQYRNQEYSTATRHPLEYLEYLNPTHAGELSANL